MTTHAQDRPSGFERLRQHWHEFAMARPGMRFQGRYRRKQRTRRGHMSSVATIFAGAVVVIVGVCLLVAPGPGLLVVLLGAGLIAEESLPAARALDALEDRMRRSVQSAVHGWRCASAAIKALIIVTAGVSAGLSAGIAYALLVS